MEEKLLGLYLPEKLLEYFELKEIKQGKEGVELWFDEKDNPPMIDQPLQSKGFLPEKELRDFPIRGKPCFLKIRRRRWQCQRDKKYLMREIKLIADGTKLIIDFAFFFEGGD